MNDMCIYTKTKHSDKNIMTSMPVNKQTKKRDNKTKWLYVYSSSLASVKGLMKLSTMSAKFLKTIKILSKINST